MEEDLIQILEALIAIAIALVAYWQRHQTLEAQNTTRQVIAFYDPEDDSVTTPPALVPTRSWTMHDGTRNWILSGHDAANQGELLRQIETAESQQLLRYFLTFDDRGGGYYEIEYGLMKGSGAGEPG